MLHGCLMVKNKQTFFYYYGFFSLGTVDSKQILYFITVHVCIFVKNVHNICRYWTYVLLPQILVQLCILGVTSFL